MEFFSVERPFRTWEYCVSHSMLLLRSVDGGTAPRIDVLFTFVLAQKLPNSMRSLCLRDPHDHEWPVFKAEIEAVDSRITMPRTGDARLFALDAGNGIGWVVAYSMSVLEDPDRWADPGLFDARPSASEVIYVSRKVVRRPGDARSWKGLSALFARSRRAASGE